MPDPCRFSAVRLQWHGVVPHGAIARAALGLGICFTPEAAVHAQVADSILITPQVPEPLRDFQELSVNQQQPTDWQALGLQIGSFNVSPQVSFKQGLTSNAYATSNARAAAIESFAVGFDIQSDWSRHGLGLRAERTDNLYVGEPKRNEHNWSVLLAGNVDVTSSLELDVEAQANQLSFNNLSGDATFDSDAIVVARQNVLSAKVTRTYNAARVFFTADHVDVNYREILAESGSGSGQSYFDHTMDRLAAQGEYSFSSSMAIFAQANYSWMDYGNVSIERSSNANSAGGRILAGARVSLSGFGRATVALGYSSRRYDRAGLDDVHGLSAEARLEAFVSPLTTITGEFGDRIADARIISGTAYRERYVQLSADHALLRNLKLNFTSRLLDQHALTSTGGSRLITTRFTSRYFSSRRFELDGSVSYSLRNYTSGSRAKVAEMAGSLSLTYKL